jgi:hypothetical protein
MTRKQWRPTREYFEQAERSTLLRNICLGAISAAQAKILDDTNEATTGLILDSNASLKAHGIVNGMHTIDPSDPDAEEKRRALQSDPIKAAEWVAGQVCKALEGSALSQGLSAADVMEHDELQGEGTYPVLRSETMSPRTQQFAVNLMGIVALANFIDHAAGPTEV